MIAQLDKVYLKKRLWKLWSRLVSYFVFEGRPLTTRGRWFNVVVFFNFSWLIKLPINAFILKPIFIIGIGRSGTTILGKVLSMHRQVGYLNEPKALWHTIYPMEDLVGNYTTEQGRYRLNESDLSSINIKTAHRLYGAFLTTSFSSRLVDKYPELIYRVPFVKGIFADARFIFLVRNGWDTCHSIKLWSERLASNTAHTIEHCTEDWWGVDNRKWLSLVEQLMPEHNDLKEFAPQMLNWTNHVDMAAVEWILAMREGITLLNQYPDDVLKIEYEALCCNSKAVLSDITDFTGLSKDDQVFEEYAQEILKPVETKHRLELHSALQVPFKETMLALGYDY